MTEPNRAPPTRKRRVPPGAASSNSPKADAMPADEAPEAATLPGVSSGKPAKTRSQKTPAEPDVPLFGTADHQVTQIRGMKMPDMQRGFQVIVRDLFESDYDVAKEYALIKDALEIRDALTPDRMRRAQNSMEDIANRAHQLYIIAKVEVSAYMRETEHIFGSIREAGIQALEHDKRTGARSKQITDADAKAAAAVLYPDEWADICTRRERAEAMLKQLENLASLVRSRCYTVSSMANPGNRSVG